MFSVPFNQTRDVFLIYEKYRNHIEEVYFPIPPHICGTCRILDYPEDMDLLIQDLIIRLKELNIESNILLNVIHDEKIFNRDSLSDIINYLYRLNKIGLDRVTIANPILFKAIKENIPELKIGLSIVGGITTVNQLKTYYDAGLEEYCIPPSMSRDKDFIDTIKAVMPELKLKLMVNCFCSPHCIAFMHHHIAVGEQKKQNDQCYFDFVCTQASENPLKKNFILPGEVKDFDYIDIFKISGREFSTEMINFILDKYTTENQNGYNLLSLLDGFTYNGAHLVNISYLREIRDNSKIQNCKFDCHKNNCTYCDEILKKYFDYEMGEM